MHLHEDSYTQNQDTLARPLQAWAELAALHPSLRDIPLL